MGQALYRAHRPKKLSEVVGQEHVTTALQRALEKGTIAHAYLFTGPRGTGKTSIARILAHEINGLPYEDDSTHLDIIEIDAASNRRIDEIRELRDKVHIAPTSAKYKVYIIDEVHMLTKEAFNALLKTLEEPPAHVVFMLATTEAHKLPETIISRTQRFSLKPVEQIKVVDHLKNMAKAEKIAIDDDALDLIAAHGEGSFRDSISLLDQVRNSGDKVTLASVQAVLGIAPKELVESLVSAVAAHDAPLVIQLLAQAHAAGHEPARMAKQLGETLRAQLLEGRAELPNNQLLDLLAKLIEVPSSGNPRANLEVALLDVTLSGATTRGSLSGTPDSGERSRAEEQGGGAASSNFGDSAEAEPVSQAFETRPEAEAQKLAPARERSLKLEDADSSPQVKEPSAEPSKGSLSGIADSRDRSRAERPPVSPLLSAGLPEGLSGSASAESPESAMPALSPDAASWPQILAAIKRHHNTLYGIVKTVRPRFESDVVTLECSTSFFQKTLNNKTNKQKIADIIQQVTGQNVRVESLIGEALKPDEVTQPAPPPLPPAEEKIHTVAAVSMTPSKPGNADVATISNIFGGAELLES